MRDERGEVSEHDVKDKRMDRMVRGNDQGLLLILSILNIL